MGRVITMTLKRGQRVLVWGYEAFVRGTFSKQAASKWDRRLDHPWHDTWARFDFSLWELRFWLSVERWKISLSHSGNWLVFTKPWMPRVHFGLRFVIGEKSLLIVERQPGLQYMRFGFFPYWKLAYYFSCLCFVKLLSRYRRRTMKAITKRLILLAKRFPFLRWIAIVFGSKYAADQLRETARFRVVSDV